MRWPAIGGLLFMPFLHGCTSDDPQRSELTVFRVDPQERLHENWRSSLTGVAALGERLVVAETRPSNVLLFTRGGELLDSLPTGRGPGEIQQVGALFPIGDSAAAAIDYGQARVLLLRADAEIIEVGLPPEIRPQQVRGMDYAGRIYYEVPKEQRSGAEGVPLLEIRRWQSPERSSDLVAVLRGAPLVETVTVERLYRASVQTTVAAPQPFAPRDDWTVLADGTVLIARSDSFRIDLVQDGQVTQGDLLPLRHVPLSEADRREYPLPSSMRASVVWPASKPIFKQRAFRSIGSGCLVLELNTAAVDSVRRYLIIGHSGGAKGILETPAAARLLHLDSTRVLLAVMDEWDRQWLHSSAPPREASGPLACTL